MVVENKDGLTIIYAEAENKITNSQRTFFSDFIYLGKFDSVDNYEEVPRSVWKQFVKDNNPTLNGAIFIGQIIPFSSLFCSTIEATILSIPIP